MPRGSHDDVVAGGTEMSCRMVKMRWISLTTLALVTLLSVDPRELWGQAKSCKIVCQPEVQFRPTYVRSHLFDNPRVRSLADGSVSKLPSKNNLMLDLHVLVPTAVSRLTLYAAMSWFPTADRKVNPYTEYTASELPDKAVRANSVSGAYGAAVTAVPTKQTNGWFGLVGYAGGVLSPSARPDDPSVYTHKLDLGSVATIGAFNWMPKATWLHDVSAYVTLDWIATGLPRKGDEVPKGERVFLDNVHGVTLQTGLALPVNPTR